MHRTEQEPGDMEPFALMAHPTQSGDLLTFALELHLPHVVLKRHATPREDGRRRSTDQHRLRKARQLPRLDPSAKGTGSILREAKAATEYLYEAQLSVCVTGSNDRVWTATAFQDNYFQGPDEDMVTRCGRLTDSHGVFQADPLTAGEKDANVPIWNPREYFLRVVEIQVDRVRKELHQIVSILQERVEQ